MPHIEIWVMSHIDARVMLHVGVGVTDLSLSKLKFVGMCIINKIIEAHVVHFTPFESVTEVFLRHCIVLHLLQKCCSVIVRCSVLQCVAVCCNVLQCVAMCCNVLQCVAVCCSVLQCVAMCCNVLQCVAMCCSVLQRVTVCNRSISAQSRYSPSAESGHVTYT